MSKGFAFILMLFALSVNAQDAIFVSDAGNFAAPPYQILKYDGDGGNPEVFIDNNLNWPQDILILEDQNVVLISNLSSNEINRHSLETGDFIDHFAEDLLGPTRMKIGPDGYIYVLQWIDIQPVLRYDVQGNFIDAFTDMGINNAIGLEWDQVGNLYVSSYGDAAIYRFDANGENMVLFIEDNLDGPTNIWIDPNDNTCLYVLDFDGNAIKKFHTDGTYLGVHISGIGQPEGVAYLPNGDLLIGHGSQGSVKRYDSDGNLLGNIISPGLGGLLQPNAVVYYPGTSLSSHSALSEVSIEISPAIGREFTIISKQGVLKRYVLLDVSGKELKKGEVTGSLFRLSALDLPAGVAFLYLTDGNGAEQVFKLVIADE